MAGRLHRLYRSSRSRWSIWTRSSSTILPIRCGWTAAFFICSKTLGHPLHTLFAEGYGFPVVHCQLDFWEPAALDERVRLTTALMRLGRTSLTVRYDFSRVEADGSLTPLARGESVHVYTQRATRQALELPPWLRALAGSGMSTTPQGEAEQQ